MKKEIRNAIEEYKLGKLSLAKIAGKYQIDRSHLSDMLKRENIEIINKQNLPRVNEHIFDSIDTEEKAYWLGFMFADGNIGKDRNSIELSLSSKDYEHMLKFKKFLQYNDDLKVTNTNFINSKRVRLLFSSKRIHDTLNIYGCVPQKSLILRFPKIEIFKDTTLVRDYIRGYVDGDGCLSYLDKSHKAPNITIIGTKQFLEELLKYIPIKANVNKRNNVYILNISRKKAYNLSNYIYSNCTIYLERKYLRYKEYCRLYQG